MRTPAGTECPHFFGDYFRGKTVEECRLIGVKPPPNQWTPDLCKSCPVPGSLRANACENMTLYPRITKGVLGKNRRIIITSYCSKSNSEVKVPEVGCGSCHQDFEIHSE